MRMNRPLPMLASLLGLVALGGTAGTQETKKAEAPKEAKKPPAVTAIVGADVYTITKGIVRGGTILVQDGKIARVGQDVAIPDGAVRIDATGKFVTPGFITVSATNLGIRAPGGPGAGNQPGPGGGAAQGKVADSLNPFDRNMLFCLGSGITTACVEMAAGGGGRFGRDTEDELDDTNLCPCCGLPILPTEPITPPAPTERTARRQTVLKLTYGDMTGMLLKESPVYYLPSGAFAGALNRYQWRDTIKRARQQLKDQVAADAGGEFGEFPGRGGQRRVPDEVLKLVEKKVPLRTEASSVEQMRDLIALAKELDYHLVLDGVHEAWLMAGELGAAKVQTVLTPRNRRRPQPGKEDSSGSSIETSAYLEKAGVPFAIAPLGTAVSLDGIPGRDLTSLALEAAFAVRGGCSEQTALEALTITPARILGLADRLGSIEEGKDADLLILDGPPLDYRTYVVTAFVGGKIYYDRQRDTIYPHVGTAKIRRADDAPAANTLTAEEKAAGWKLLFDGKSTNGWRAYRGKDVPDRWQVVNGTLVLDQKQGKRGGDILTVDQFDNFELVFDWAIAKNGNSGLMYRVTEDGPAPYFSGPEYQLLDNAGHEDGKNPLTAAASAYAVYAPTKDVTKAVGEWNRSKIVANGNHIEHWLNGEKVVEYEMGSADWLERVKKSKWKDVPQYGKSPKGHIDLQDHGDKVEFRNIKIRTLK